MKRKSAVEMMAVRDAADLVQRAVALLKEQSNEPILATRLSNFHTQIKAVETREKTISTYA